jgi:hypothetical protein
MNKRFKFTTPVLFLTFNRLNVTKKVFAEIKRAKPKELFLASDGPRNKKEAKKINEVRRYLLNNIDWNCRIEKLFHNKNLGSRIATPFAITWFFKSVKCGIILEDDCLPNQSFFKFCQDMLEKYRDESRVSSICGYNPLSIFNDGEKYLFSRQFYCWGWSTWQDRWDERDLKLKKYFEIKKKGRLSEFYPNLFERMILYKKVKNCINESSNGKLLKHWDIPFGISARLNNLVSVVPSKNMVENVGFSYRSYVNTKKNFWDQKYLVHKRNEIQLPIKKISIKVNHPFEKDVLIQEIKRIFLKKITSLKHLAVSQYQLAFKIIPQV